MKKIIKYIIFSLAITFLISLIGIYGYAYFRTRVFNENGLTFDYLKEIDNYKDKIYYEQLNNDEKKIYHCLYHASSNLDTEFMYEGYYNAEYFDRALNAFCMDWPKHFYWLTTSNVEEDLYDTAIVHSKSTYLYLDSLKEDYQIINDKVDQILKEVIVDDDYETIKNIHDYLIDVISYDDSNYSVNSFEHSKHNDIVSALIDNETMCNGYASAFQLLASKAGYNCSIVAGYVNSKPHAWNLIEINGKWYNVDVTYDELILENSKEVGTSYEYFLSTDELFKIDHFFDKRFVYPKCKDETFYFYNMPGFICRNDDTEYIKKNMGDLLKSGSHEISIKFTKFVNANNVYEWLYTQGNIEDILEANITHSDEVIYHYSFNKSSNLLYFYYE